MINKRDYAFVELTFLDEDKAFFNNLVQEIVPTENLYYSNEVAHIKGNMSNTLHCTVFFGLTPDSIYNPELNDIIDSAKISDVKLGDFFFFEGYQGMYKILCIEVIDDGKLLELSNKIKQFASFRKESTKPFRPHITLAYVDNDFQLPGELPSFPETLTIDKLKITLQSDFVKLVEGLI